EDGIRDDLVTGVQTCALPIYIVIMPMIETAEALKNLDAILSTPGVDAVYVGPSDLSLALGCKPRLDQTDAPVVQAQQQIVEACRSEERRVGKEGGSGVGRETD